MCKDSAPCQKKQIEVCSRNHHEDDQHDLDIGTLKMCNAIIVVRESTGANRAESVDAGVKQIHSSEKKKDDLCQREYDINFVKSPGCIGKPCCQFIFGRFREFPRWQQSDH